MSDESRLDPELGRLFDAEARANDELPLGAEERLTARLTDLLDVPSPRGPGSGGTDGGGAGGGGAGDSGGGRALSGAASSTRAMIRNAALAIGGGIVGAALHGALAAPRIEVRYVDRTVTMEVASSVSAASVSAAPVLTAPVLTAPAMSAFALTAPAISVQSSTTIAPSAPRLAPTATALSTDEALARERSIVDTARAAIARGDGAAALVALENHARTFPRGQLVEERDALTVRALVLAGNEADANARAKKFHERYPSSVLGPVVDSAFAKKK